MSILTQMLTKTHSILKVHNEADPRLLRLQAILNPSSHEGSNSLFFSSRLPLELYLNVLSSPSLSEGDLIRISQVCTSWRKAVLSSRSLWTELNDIDLADSEGSINRVKFIAGRARGALRRLDMDVGGDEGMGEGNKVVGTLRTILCLISSLDGGKALKSIKLNLGTCQDDVELEPAYQLIPLLLNFATFSSSHLSSLVILTPLPRFAAGAPFLNSLPNLKKLVVSSETDEPYVEARLPDIFYETGDGVGGVEVEMEVDGDDETKGKRWKSGLNEWILCGVSLTDTSFPNFPHLVTLKLFDVKVSSIYILLSSCSNSLTHLSLRNISTDPVLRWLRKPSPPMAPKDLPLPLQMPKLLTVDICGSSPLLWIPIDNVTSKTFLIEAPVLRKVAFGNQRRFDLEWASEIELDDYSGVNGMSKDSCITKEMLGYLLRGSPALEEVDLSETNVTAEMLIASLPFAGDKLQKLDISDLTLGARSGINDDFIDRLHAYLPSLRHLSLKGHSSTVTLPALARLAHNLRPKPVGFFSLEPITFIYFPIPTPPNPIINATSTSTTDLRKLLLTLSEAQLDHIILFVTLNLPPGPNANQPSSFVALEQEIRELAKPSQELKSQKLTMEREVAGWEILAETKWALIRWQREREGKWAKEWCERERVELKEDDEEDVESDSERWWED